MGLINLGGVVGCVISEGPGVFVGLPNVVKAWSTQVYALFVGNLFFASAQLIFFFLGLVLSLKVPLNLMFSRVSSGKILMQRRYTLILVDSEALEARWYCSILKFQLHLALILLFRLLWEFFKGKTSSTGYDCQLSFTSLVPDQWCLEPWYHSSHSNLYIAYMHASSGNSQ
ncbi:hypothetical protein H0E87_026267, partial [Populus deltoides]